MTKEDFALKFVDECLRTAGVAPDDPDLVELMALLLRKAFIAGWEASDFTNERNIQ